jgi:hypothetical protein
VLPATLATLGEAAMLLRGGPALIVVGENFRDVAAQVVHSFPDASAAVDGAAAHAAGAVRSARGRA